MNCPTCPHGQHIGWCKAIAPGGGKCFCFYANIPDRPHARNTDPWTSHAAAESIAAERIRKSQQAILDVFTRHGPLDDTRLLQHYMSDRTSAGYPEQSVSGIRTRRSELVTAGLLRNSGRTRVLPSKRRSIIWERA